MGRRMRVVALLLLACSRPAAAPLPPLAPPPPPAPPPPEEVVETSLVDLAALPVIPVAAGGDPVVELHAQDVQLDWLLLHLADSPIVTLASPNAATVTGRLIAPSRRSALEALLDGMRDHGLDLTTPDIAGTGRKVDLALARMPVQELAMLLAEHLGADIIATIWNRPVTVIVRDAPADGVLGAMAGATRGTLRREQGVWLLEPDLTASRPFARRYAPRQPVELWLDAVTPFDATGLVRAVAPLPKRVCGGGSSEISARLRRAPLTLVRDALFREVGGFDCSGPSEWGGSRPEDGLRVTGVARSAGRAAVLVGRANERPMLIRPESSRSKVVIGPTSIGIRNEDWSWEAAVAAPELPAEVPGARDFAGRWRLAATLREGTVWRALLVGDAGALWVSSTEIDRVRSISPGRIVLTPDRAGDPPTTLRLRRP